jgi:hypothetical protein
MSIPNWIRVAFVFVAIHLFAALPSQAEEANQALPRQSITVW